MSSSVERSRESVERSRESVERSRERVERSHEPQVDHEPQEDPIAHWSSVTAPVDCEAWQVIRVLPRLDAENHADLMAEIHSVLALGARRLALDLTQNRFFSLGAIQLCVSLARDLAADSGALALVGGGERTKRHFETYGSLKQITIVRSMTELVQDRTQSVVIRSSY